MIFSDPNFDESFNEFDAVDEYEECDRDKIEEPHLVDDRTEHSLVQEVYEFGESENCVIESDHNSIVDEHDEDAMDVFSASKTSALNDNDEKHFFSPNRFPLFNGKFLLRPLFINNQEFFSLFFYSKYFCFYCILKDLLKPTKTMKTTQVPELQNLLENKSTD